MTRLLFIVMLVVVLSNTVLAVRPVQRFAEFGKLSDKVVAAINAAEQRVWLVSPFISDYDISLALYLAVARQLDVRVVLGQERLQDMLSQYGYLLSQQVEVRLGYAIGATVLICDDKMYRVNSDLDFLSERRNLVLQHIVQPDIKSYAVALGVIDPPVHGKVYDYSRKRHRQPDYISGRLPRKTISISNHKPSRGAS